MASSTFRCTSAVGSLDVVYAHPPTHCAPPLSYLLTTVHHWWLSCHAAKNGLSSCHSIAPHPFARAAERSFLALSSQCIILHSLKALGGQDGRTMTKPLDGEVQRPQPSVGGCPLNPWRDFVSQGYCCAQRTPHTVPMPIAHRDPYGLGGRGLEGYKPTSLLTAEEATCAYLTIYTRADFLNGKHGRIENATQKLVGAIWWETNRWFLPTYMNSQIGGYATSLNFSQFCNVELTPIQPSVYDENATW
jgi:hypothetical protein